jgi:hypothetical protein
MLSPSAQWLSLVRQQHTQLVVIALYVWNDSAVETYYFTSHEWAGSVGSSTINPCLISADGLGRSQDPRTREISIPSLEASFVLDEQWKTLLTAYGIKGTQLRVWYGMPEILTVADMMPIFGGVIEGVEAIREDGVLRLTVEPLENRLNQPVLGGWAALHLLQAAERIIRHLGVYVNGIDGTSLDPATYSASHSHWVVTRITEIGNGKGHGTIEGTRNAREELNEIAVMLDGLFCSDEAGVWGFRPFDAAASPVANWSDDDLDVFEVEDLYGNIANRVRVNAHREPSDDGPKYVAGYAEDDTDSQDRYGYVDPTGGLVPTIFAWSKDLQWHSGWALVQGDNWTASSPDGENTPGAGDGDTFQAHSATVFGMCGMRWSQREFIPDADVGVDEYYTDFPGGSHPSDAQLSSSRTAYLQIEDEIIEVDQCTPGTTHRAKVNYEAEVNREPFVHALLEEYPGIATFRVKNRGALGTTAAAHTIGTFTKIRDITIPVAMVKARIDRWVNGGTVVRVTTRSLEWMKIELGDLVTVTTDRFIGFGKDGLTTATKWEVIEKVPRPDDDHPHVEFRLAYAGETSPPSATVVGYLGYVRALSPFELALRGDVDQVAASIYVESGFGFVDDGGRDGTIQAGAAAGLYTRSQQLSDIPITFTASKDTYVTHDVATGRTITRETSVGAGTPTNIGATEVLLWVITTDASDITGTEDLRPTRSIRGQKVLDQTLGDNAVSLQNLGVINANPAFAVQTDTDRPPDGWEIKSPNAITWGTEVDLVSSPSESGTGSIAFPAVAASEPPTIQGVLKIPLKDYQLYRLSTNVRATRIDAGDIVRVYALVEYSGGDFAEYAFAGQLAAANVWEDSEIYFWGTTAPQCRLFAEKEDVSGFAAYVDHIILEEAMPEFLVGDPSHIYNGTPSTWVKMTSFVLSSSLFKGYNHGALWTAGSTDRLDVVARSGIARWQFDTLIEIDTDGVAEAALYVNGTISTLMARATRPDPTSDAVLMGSATLELEDGDYVELFVRSTDDFEILATLQSFFRGRQLKR